MDALVSEVAVTGRPDPMPIIVEMFAHERVFWSGPAPEVVINGSGDGLGTIHFADAGAAFVAKAAGPQDFPDVSFTDPFNGFGDSGAVAGLGAGLYNSVVFAGGGDDLTSFPNVMGYGLFEVHVLAGLDRPNGAQGMPMVRSGESDCV